MESKTICGVVRHYWIAKNEAHQRKDPEHNAYAKAGTHYHPYLGILKRGTDLEDFKRDPVQEFLATLPDGEEVEITVKPKGKSQCARGFVWALVKANTYERIPESDFERLVQMEITGNFKKIPYQKWDADKTDLEEVT